MSEQDASRVAGGDASEPAGQPGDALETAPRYVNLTPGDPAPWFRTRSPGNPNYVFDTVGGRYIVLCFFGTMADPHGRAAVEAGLARADIFNDEFAAFFGVSNDAADEQQGRVKNAIPGRRFFYDFDANVARLYGVAPVDAGDGAQPLRRLWVILDPTLRVIRLIPFAPDNADIAEALDFVAALPPPERFAGFEVSAPIIILPNIFEREFCDRLIAHYEEIGGEESGFMREVDGKTVPMYDNSHKRRRDVLIEDEQLIRMTQARVLRKLVPEIQKVHQFRVTRMERYIVVCYDAAEGGHFRQHRDNTTKGTAHRRFAVSINLNADFDGGDISFPEYGPRKYRPPHGGAVVFSCSLLHMVSPVTRGRRFAFLPFVYDDAAAKIREENIAFLEGGGSYKA